MLPRGNRIRVRAAFHAVNYARKVKKISIRNVTISSYLPSSWNCFLALACKHIRHSFSRLTTMFRYKVPKPGTFVSARQQQTGVLRSHRRIKFAYRSCPKEESAPYIFPDVVKSLSPENGVCTLECLMLAQFVFEIKHITIRGLHCRLSGISYSRFRDAITVRGVTKMNCAIERIYIFLREFARHVWREALTETV